MPIEIGKSGAASISGNAINWYQVLVLKSGIEMYVKHGIIPRRGFGPAQMRQLATAYTGVTYPRSRKGLLQALTDISAIIPRDPDTVVPDGNQGG